MTRRPKTEMEIDRIVDELVVDEATATELKSRLRKSLAEEDADYTGPALVASDGEAAEELWDNMPV
ncbi:hypothetical protein [Celeribacter indicus]|uniref:hypothetical protein n=1 Tax=Celeribacter indicus TaxID=1208324 RepID=UPI00089A32CA|nr:hypothetical protein [Celeribacter indicus]SDW15302.1 hypothetical protein SAMN05443573_101573 [Celeribacter indicus]